MPVLIIAILTVAAIICLLARSTKIAKAVSMVAFAVSAVLALSMTASVVSGKPITMVLGENVFNISLKVGVVECFMACIYTVVGFLLIWASLSMIGKEIEEEKIPVFYFLMLGLVATLCGVVFFDNLINIYVFIELSSFAAAALVIVKTQQENMRAGLKYLSLSILGSGLVLMGTVILFSLTGSLTMDGIHTGLTAGGFYHAHKVPITWAFALMTVGVAFKSALFPCHIWLPDAYTTAPSPSSAILSSLVSKTYIIFYIKMLFRVLGFELVNTETLRLLLNVVLTVGVVAMIAGSLFAILQTELKRMIAYSSVAQIGYIFMGLGLGTPLGVYAALFHILAHILTKSGLFLAAGSVIEQTGERDLTKLNGFGVLMPLTFALFTIGSLSMVGIPLFVGFNSKWNFAVAIMDSKALWVLIALSVSALLNALYYLPVVIRAFFSKEVKENNFQLGAKERPFKDMLPIVLLTSLVIFFGVSAGPISSLIQAGIAGL